MRYDPRADRAKRGAALARPELRGGLPFNSVSARLPDIGRMCVGWASDGHGDYRLPFPVVRKSDDQWYNANFDRPLEVVIVGWTYGP